MFICVNILLHKMHFNTDEKKPFMIPLFCICLTPKVQTIQFDNTTKIIYSLVGVKTFWMKYLFNSKYKMEYQARYSLL